MDYIEICEIKSTPPKCEFRYKVANPGIGFFVDKIINKDYFMFMHWNHGLWDWINTAMASEKFYPIPNPIPRSYIDDLCAEAVNKNPKSDKMWGLNSKLFADILWKLISPKISNFLCGITCRCYFKHRHYPESYVHRKEILEKFLSNTPLIFNGLIWTKYVINKTIDDFFKALKNYELILIGPFWLSEIVKAYDFKKLTFIEMPYAHAALDAHNILSSILANSLDNLCIILNGGYVGTWLANKIFEINNHCFIIDLGRALEFLSTTNFSDILVRQHLGLPLLAHLPNVQADAVYQILKNKEPLSISTENYRYHNKFNKEFGRYQLIKWEKQ